MCRRSYEVLNCVHVNAGTEKIAWKIGKTELPHFE